MMGTLSMLITKLCWPLFFMRKTQRLAISGFVGVLGCHMTHCSHELETESTSRMCIWFSMWGHSELFGLPHGQHSNWCLLAWPLSSRDEQGALPMCIVMFHGLELNFGCSKSWDVQSYVPKASSHFCHIRCLLQWWRSEMLIRWGHYKCCCCFCCEIHSYWFFPGFRRVL